MKKERTLSPITCSMSDAAQWLRTHGITEAASRKAAAPEEFSLKIARGDDLATLKRQLVRTGAILATREDAAEVAKMVAKLRRGNPLTALFSSAKAEEEEDFPDCAEAPDAPEEESSEESAPEAEPESPEAEFPEAETPAEEAAEETVAEETAEETVEAVSEADAPEDPPQVETPAAAWGNAPAEAEAAEATPPAVPEKKAAREKKEKKEYFFLLLIDGLENVPSLMDLPGVQPDLTIIAPMHACEGDMQEALRFAHGIATDTLWEKKPDKTVTATVTGTLSTSRTMLEARMLDAQQTAKMLLLRGHDGGYVHMTGKAVREVYGLPLGKAMELVEPALQQMMEGAAPTIATYAPLRMRDLHLLAGKSLHPRRAMARRLTEDELEQALRSLYRHPECRLSVEELLPMQRQFFATGKTLDVAFRLRQLDILEKWMDLHEKDILHALYADLHKGAFEAYETEILLVKEELKTMRKHLPQWQRPKRVTAPLMHFPSKCRIYRDPYGLSLIMSPWNYPFLLSIDPLLSAIAGGNCAVLKPSAYAPATSALLHQLVSDLYDPEYIAVVEGGRAENQSLLAQKFDVIFFTGSPAVGKVVMKAAAEHLTPVTLELGGKSPCIVDDTADLDLAAKRIAWGKFINAGQTCVAPDYILCSSKTAPKLAKALECAIRSLYGAEPLTSPDLCRIVNEKHFDRLLHLMEYRDVACGGKHRREDLLIEPTVLQNVSRQDAVMQEEIFGPVLPIVNFDGDFDALLQDIEAQPRPLAAYLFTRDKGHEEKFLRRLRFGGGCVNDVVCHLATSKMPFGGVGESGMGSYHGRRGFETFTHEKSILKKSGKIDVKVRYAPYKDKKINLLKRFCQ